MQGLLGDLFVEARENFGDTGIRHLLLENGADLNVYPRIVDYGSVSRPLMTRLVDGLWILRVLLLWRCISRNG